MGSDVIYYEYEKRKKFEDYDMKADAELGTFRIRRYHFDDESFVHPLHSVRFHPDRPYEIPIKALMADKILSPSKDEKPSTERPRSSRRPTPHYSPRTMPVAQRQHFASSVKGTRSFRPGTTSSSVRKSRSWELIAPSEGWMCDADDEKEIGGMEPPVKNEESSEEDPEMEEEEPNEAGNPEDRIPATPSLPMDIDAEEDFQRRAPEPSPLRSSQPSVPDEPADAADRQSVSRDGPSYNLSGDNKLQMNDHESAKTITLNKTGDNTNSPNNNGLSHEVYDENSKAGCGKYKVAMNPGHLYTDEPSTTSDSVSKIAESGN
ncbi:hypothetical protein PIB30_014725 [Stylosanthes scabra]|uniref:Uncharacterized protein n=1 Tax=Stylosanthes scabra TaxID=79078 RepID=A0ABU6W7J1_9FABA|nr:hypothetical protein [Stylosanthes scabra]